MSNTTTRLAVVVDDTTCELMQVCRPTEEQMIGIRAECRASMLLSVQGTHEDLPELGRRAVWETIPGEPDGWLPGSNNSAWYVTDEQADALRTLNARYAAEAVAREAREDALYAAEDAAATKPCPRCGTYCYGDCEAN
jgi:hypothetical protein